MLRISIIALFLLALNGTYAQSPQITVSQEKVNQNGVIKYVHHVKKGETLYSISKAYGVGIDILTNDNPNIKGGLKDGMILLIPSHAQLQQSQQQQLQKAESNSNQGNYKKHTSKWYETIDDIAAKYNVNAEDIIELNKLKSTTLAKRQVLLIPNNTYTTQPKVESTIKPENIIHENRISEENNSIEEPTITSPITKRDPLKEIIDITYILPINGLDSANINSNFMDFYTGSLLALEDLKEKGLKIKVNLIDQFNFPISDVINLNKLRETEVVIGPIRKKDVQDILHFTKGLNIPIVSPMDQTIESLLDTNRTLIQIPSLSEAQIVNLVDELKNDYSVKPDSSNVLLLFEDGIQDSKIVEQTKGLLANKRIEYKELSYSILEGRKIQSSISNLLDTTYTNYVIIPSTNEAYVNDIIRNLNLVHKSRHGSKKIKVYGLSRWRNYETIEPENFHNMGLKLSIPYYIDYSDPNISSFLLKYRSLFNNEPTPYSYQGYDITTYIVDILSKYGKDFINMDTLPYSELFQSNIELKRITPESGYSNLRTRDIEYQKDFTIIMK